MKVSVFVKAEGFEPSTACLEGMLLYLLIFNHTHRTYCYTRVYNYQLHFTSFKIQLIY